MRLCLHLVSWASIAVSLSGCNLHPRVTAHPASPQNMCEPSGIPFYLPKPILVVSKNVYHIEDAKVGLTGTAPIPAGFDNQEGYGNVNMQSQFTRTTSSSGSSKGDTNDDAGEATSSIAHSPTLHSSGAPVSPPDTGLPSDMLSPHTFYTYEVIFVPDLTQKYVLEVKGGPGEMRAAMNLVNGWQFTGLGPYYMKDSSTAQNLLSTGIAANLGLGGVGDVISSVANLRGVAGAGDMGDRTVSTADMVAVANALKEASLHRKVDFEAVDKMWRKRTTIDSDGTNREMWLPPALENYAEVHFYEAVLQGDQMVWRPIVDHAFDREFLGVITTTVDAADAGDGNGQEPAAGGPDSGIGTGGGSVQPAENETPVQPTDADVQSSESLPPPRLDSPLGSFQKGLKNSLNSQMQKLVYAPSGNQGDAQNGHGGRDIPWSQPPEQLPLVESDSELVREVVRQTMAPTRAHKPRSIIRFLKRPVVESKEVNAEAIVQ